MEVVLFFALVHGRALIIKMKTILYSDLELPRASVLRIVKNSVKNDSKIIPKIQLIFI
jgi:hypothetical protein